MRSEFVAMSLHFPDDGRDQSGERLVDLPCARHRKSDPAGNDPEQHHRVRIATDQPSRIEEVRDPDLVHRQAVANGVPDRLAIEPYQCPGRFVGRHRIDQDQMLGLGDLIEEREPERAAIGEAYAGRRAVLRLQPCERQRPYPVIAQNHVAEPENEHRVASIRARASTAHRFGAFLRDSNLKPEKIESKIPNRSTVE